MADSKRGNRRLRGSTYVLAPAFAAGSIFLAASPAAAYATIGTGCQFRADAGGLTIASNSANANVQYATGIAVALWAPGAKTPPLTPAPDVASARIVVNQYFALRPESAYTSTDAANPAANSFPAPTCGALEWTQRPVIWANTRWFDDQAVNNAQRNVSRIGHEIGHAYGLAHPRPDGSTFGGCSTVDNSLMWWNAASFNNCGTATLQADDIAGLNALYK